MRVNEKWKRRKEEHDCERSDAEARTRRRRRRSKVDGLLALPMAADTTAAAAASSPADFCCSCCSWFCWCCCCCCSCCGCRILCLPLSLSLARSRIDGLRAAGKFDSPKGGRARSRGRRRRRRRRTGELQFIMAEARGARTIVEQQKQWRSLVWH